MRGRSALKKSAIIEMPECVKAATGQYRENSDWLENFITEKCEVGSEYSVSSGELYSCYREFCLLSGEYTRSTTDFYAAIDFAGYQRKRTSGARLVCGLRLKKEIEPLVGKKFYG